MIVEWLMDMGMSIGSFFWGIFPPPHHDVHDGIAVNLGLLAGYTGSLSAWVNWPALLFQVQSVMGLYFTFLSFKAFRALIGHVPFFGGTG